MAMACEICTQKTILAMKKFPICSAMQLSMFANFAYIVDSTKCPTEIFHSCIYPSSRAVLSNKRNFYRFAIRS